MIYLFLADGFEEIEALATVDILRRAELDVRTVGVGSKTVAGAHGICVTADLAEKEVTTDDMTAIVLPGGMPGTLNLRKSPIVEASIRYCEENRLLIGAICAAPSILGQLGLLSGRKAVCFPGFEDQLFGAEVEDLPVCRDGHIVTARGAGVAIDFALELAGILAGEKISQKIGMSMQCI